MAVGSCSRYLRTGPAAAHSRQLSQERPGLICLFENIVRQVPLTKVAQDPAAAGLGNDAKRGRPSR
jgi:hypothetical protein